jgi:hypothetical protein
MGTENDAEDAPVSYGLSTHEGRVEVAAMMEYLLTELMDSPGEPTENRQVYIMKLWLCPILANNFTARKSSLGRVVFFNRLKNACCESISTLGSWLPIQQVAGVILWQLLFHDGYSSTHASSCGMDD